MSTYGIERRIIDTLVRNNGRMPEADYQAIADEALRGGRTSGEARALLDPGYYLGRSRKLREAGIDVDAIVWEAGAIRIAQKLGQETGLTPTLPGASVTPPSPTDIATARAARDAAAAKGADLGKHTDW